MSDPRLAEMISKMAHELRSPLTSVKGFSSMLMKRWDRFTDEQKFQFVETIHHDAERMSRIVSEVLDLARLESGRLELHKANHALEPIAERAGRNVAMLPGAERISTTIPEGLIVEADADRLESVLTNLLENAVKFSDDGPISLEASASGDMVEIKVVDHGVGVDPGRHEEIFQGPQPTRADAAMPSGGGLGLYLARGVLKAHGGSISLEADEDADGAKGTTFIVTLPGRGAA